MKRVISKKYTAIFAVAVFSSWMLHELFHWLMGNRLGYDMVMTLNSSYPAGGQYRSDADFQLISAAGPLFTLCEAILVFFLMKYRRMILLYPFLFTCFYMRFLAGLISILNPNDEARISTALGLGEFTLPAVMATILFMLCYSISKKYALGIKFNLANLGLAILFSTMIILSDMYGHIRIL